MHSLGDKWRFARKRITANRSASAPLHSVPHSSSNAYVRRRRNSTALSNNDECAALNRLMLHLSTLPQFCLSLKSTLSLSLFLLRTLSLFFSFSLSRSFGGNVLCARASTPAVEFCLATTQQRRSQLAVSSVSGLCGALLCVRCLLTPLPLVTTTTTIIITTTINDSSADSKSERK